MMTLELFVQSVKKCYSHLFKNSVFLPRYLVSPCHVQQVTFIQVMKETEDSNTFQKISVMNPQPV
jgi:hypothetical protein